MTDIRFLLLKSTITKWLKHIILLSIFLFIAYLGYLNNLVKDEFEKPVDSSYSQLSLEQYPKALINMLLLVEDQSFFQHSGVDFAEIARVIRDTVVYDKPIRGASTITQQLIKNTLLSREQTLTRKSKEILMALLFEYSFDKTFILQRYLNTVYMGQKGNLEVRGFAQASQFYFHKSVDTLTLEEMATLVSLLKGPSYYHPIKHSQRLAKRRDLVLSIYHKFEKIVK